MADTINNTIHDDAVCCFCDQRGVLVACDGCDKTMHWWCNDESRQPTADGYYCKDCSAERGIASTPHAFLHHQCLICFETKPADQFVKTLPECPCPNRNNRACALCVYKMAHVANGDSSKCKCPTCRAAITKFVLPPTARSAAQVVPIEPLAAPPEAPDAPDAPRPVLRTEDNPGDFGGAPVLSSSDDDSDDSDDDSDYDGDSIVGVHPSRRPPSTRGSLGSMDRSDESSGSDSEPEPKRRRGPAKSRVLVVPKEQCPSAGMRPSKNPKKDPGYRVVGTLPSLITDPDHELSKYDTEEKRTSILEGVTRGFSGDDLADPEEIDPAAVAAHCFVLMFRAGYQVGQTGSSSLTKHPKRIRALMTAELGLASKAQFKKSFEPVARQVAERVAAEEAKRPSINTPVHTIAKNYMSAFNCYCKMLEKERKGEINAILE